MRDQINDAQLPGERHGAEGRQGPNQKYRLDGSAQVRHGVSSQRTADGQIALDGEGGDGENGGVGGGLGRPAAEDAEALAEDVGIALPEHVELLRQAEHEQQQVGDGETEEVEVGGRVHVLVAGDHRARAQVADGARQQDDAVDDRHRHHRRQRLPHGTNDVEQLHLSIFRPRGVRGGRRSVELRINSDVDELVDLGLHSF